MVIPMDPWQAKEPDRLPDFIIGGAMKSGTTSFHAILNSHPDISIAQNELGFFDIDSIVQHPDFNFYDKRTKQWTRQSMESNRDLLWNWYFSQFETPRKEGKLIGEDSTTYLTSRIAAKRIGQQEKPIKMIFILRHPTERTLSNYLHLLKSGRAFYNLEDTLKYDPHSIVKRSLYLEQLEAYYHYMPAHRIKVILFEDLVNNKEACIKSVCEFLDVEFERFLPTDLDVHSNKTMLPKYKSLQLFRNRLMQRIGDYRYSSFLPIQPVFQNKLPIRFRIIDRLYKKINPKRSDYKFVPSESTVQMLNTFFRNEMQGIDELTQETIYKKWFKD